MFMKSAPLKIISSQDMMVGYSSISALAVASFFMQRRPRQAPDMYHFFRFLTNFVTVEGW